MLASMHSEHVLLVVVACCYCGVHLCSVCWLLQDSDFIPVRSRWTFSQTAASGQLQGSESCCGAVDIVLLAV